MYVGLVEMVVLTIRYIIYYYILWGEGRGACVTCWTLLNKLLLLFISGFMVAWYIAGNVWFFSEENDCESEFPEAYWVS
jgi:hypothetical protein